METAAEPQTQPAAILLPPSLITCEREFLAALRARREELKIGYETIEAIADMSPRYAYKLLSGACPMGALSMWMILQTLGLGIQLVEDPAALDRAKRHHQWEIVRRKPRPRRWSLRQISIARRRNAPWLWDPEKAREYNDMAVKARRKNLDAQAALDRAAKIRTEKARKAALARWSKPRLTEVTNSQECRELRTSTEGAKRSRE